MYVVVPVCWERQTKECEILSLWCGGPEYEEILQLFMKTMEEWEVQTIHRVQNPLLWRRYCHRKKELKGDPALQCTDECRLFRGTQKTDPKEICRGGLGFDMLTLKEMWNKQNHFAEMASHSNKFSYETSDGLRQILLAKVLVCACKEMKTAVDKTVRPPREREVAGQKAGNTKSRTDGVDGESQGKTASYPEYIITYRYKM